MYNEMTDLWCNQLIGVFCDGLKFGSTAALDCRTGQNKGRYCEKESLLLLISLELLLYCRAIARWYNGKKEGVLGLNYKLK